MTPASSVDHFHTLSNAEAMAPSSIRVSGVEVIRCPRQRALVGEWRRLAADCFAPRFTDFPPDKLPHYVDELALVAVIADNPRPRYLIHFQGANITQNYESEGRGRYLDEILAPVIYEAAAQLYARCIELRKPVYSVSVIPNASGSAVSYERLLLPFTQDGKSIDRVLVGLHIRKTTDPLDQRSMMRQMNGAQSFDVHTVIDDLSDMAASA